MLCSYSKPFFLHQVTRANRSEILSKTSLGAQPREEKKKPQTKFIKKKKWIHFLSEPRDEAEIVVALV